MASFYEMPSISPTMEVGTLIEWRLKEGDSFTPQTVIAEVGTDKANMEAEVFDNGVLLKLLIEEGDEVPPGYPIAIIGSKKGEDISALLAEFEQRKAAAPAPKAEAAEQPAEEQAAPEPEAEAVEAAPAKAAPAKAAPAKAAPARPAAAAEPQPAGKITRKWMGKELSAAFADPPGDIRAAQPPRPRIAASPLAKAIARDKGLDLARLKGTGPGGRIVRADVDGYQPSGGSSLLPRPPVGDDQVLRNSPMRKTIAKRLLQSHQDIPTFFLTAIFDADPLVALRTQLKAALPDVKISYNDMVIAAVGRALRDYPKANATWGDKAITRHGGVHVGMAVALPDGLITPVIRDADQKDLATIAAETRELAGRARDGKLDPSEYTGGTFTVSNLGMMQIDEFTAIINPPEAGILAIGALQQEPIVKDGALAVGWRMKTTMTCDHRVIDGMVGSEFLQVLRRYLENPILLVM